MKHFLGLCGLFLFFGFGLFISFSSSEFPMEISTVPTPRASRDPASIKKVYDFSSLGGSALDFATKQRLLEGARVVREKNDVGVELGHFVIRGSSGQKEFACQTYSQIVLSFEGEGVAVAGEHPSMEVEGACEISSDINRIAAVWIPVSRILGEPVADGEFDYREGHPAKLKFSNVSDQWPTLWQLKSVRLTDPSGKVADVIVQAQDLKELVGKPFLVNF
ncbi:MAG: hypothetical protein COT73_06990 [Bdellovibrio sp. CG10_big_fil_rev_8_21_14_0_10_47_8]|nr:MAG: hypothetical protein COT73_06990 [Bdellovibrio sp. CG10_big_fil_rev_8_21_14_0_10_47_8]